jgi:hypothetical protein
VNLVAERFNGEYRITSPEVGELTFDEMPGGNYLWGGYATGWEEFRQFNFRECHIDGQLHFMCSEENAVALLEYVETRSARLKGLQNLMECLGSEMDYWFMLAWECGMASYQDLPDWCQEFLDLCVKQRRIISCNIATEDLDDDVFIFSERSVSEISGEDFEDLSRRALVECLEARVEFLEEITERLDEEDEELEACLKQLARLSGDLER